MNGGRCAFCPARAIHAHHVIRKQRIEKALHTDPRNLLPVCRDCHSRLHSGGPNALRETTLPDGFYDFVAEHSLYGQLPRHLQSDETYELTRRPA